jgi:hypothetical protein
VVVADVAPNPDEAEAGAGVLADEAPNVNEGCAVAAGVAAGVADDD